MQKQPEKSTPVLGVAFDEPVTRVKGVTLESLWQKAVAIKLSDEGRFISLQVVMDERPISLMEDNGWLAWVDRLEPGKWEVGLWNNSLAMQCHYHPQEAVALSAVKIFSSIEGLTPESWRELPYPVATPTSEKHIPALG